MQNNIYLTSDLHLGHKRILELNPERCAAMGISEELLKNNPIEAIKQHDEWIINMWNSTVKKNDMVYILGDFCLGGKGYIKEILARLKGKKYFIKGNHDGSMNGLENYFQGFWQIKQLKCTKQQFPFVNEGDDSFCCELCHFPMLSWNRKSHGSCMVHGHCHGAIDNINSESKELRVDVGLDSKLANYHLVSIEQLYNYFSGLKEAEGVATFEEYILKKYNDEKFVK